MKRKDATPGEVDAPRRDNALRLRRSLAFRLRHSLAFRLRRSHLAVWLSISLWLTVPCGIATFLGGLHALWRGLCSLKDQATPHGCRLQRCWFETNRLQRCRFGAGDGNRLSNCVTTRASSLRRRLYLRRTSTALRFGTCGKQEAQRSPPQFKKRWQTTAIKQRVGATHKTLGWTVSRRLHTRHRSHRARAQQK